MKKYYNDTFVDMSNIEHVKIVRYLTERVLDIKVGVFKDNYTPLPIPNVDIYFKSGAKVTLRGDTAQEFLKDHKQYISE